MINNMKNILLLVLILNIYFNLTLSIECSNIREISNKDDSICNIN